MQENSEANNHTAAASTTTNVAATTLLRALSRDYEGDATAIAEPEYEIRRFDSMPEQLSEGDHLNTAAAAARNISNDLTENAHQAEENSVADSLGEVLIKALAPSEVHPTI